MKKFSDQAVIPGDIVVRQRGTQFHPGQHVGIGRDHTLYALVPGYVRFYTKKWMNNERKYVGIALNRGEKLPRDEAASVLVQFELQQSVPEARCVTMAVRLVKGSA